MKKTEQDIRLVPFFILIIMEKYGIIYLGRMSIMVFNSSTGIKGLPDFIVDEEKFDFDRVLRFVYHDAVDNVFIVFGRYIVECILDLLIVLSRILSIMYLLGNIYNRNKIPYGVFKRIVSQSTDFLPVLIYNIFRIFKYYYSICFILIGMLI